ncbi:unnamed protein product [Effrenium voratum]|uniref:Uncharacterized protein n=1 Tax=Effrenium voratum TaxID=2562239 RepID=A0AA36IFS2_9DINO|nr:unnamed protein product [Effrenium voratum]
MEERQAAYDAWHAERDPALLMFRRLFGAAWTEEFTQEVLFPGSKAGLGFGRCRFRARSKVGSSS